jgi:hypothetical protein
MNDGPDATARLFAEVLALRIVTQRLAAHMGAAFGDMNRFLRSEHGMALGDLSRTEINDVDPERAQAIREMAESVVDRMYTVMRQGDPPSS